MLFPAAVTVPDKAPPDAVVVTATVPVKFPVTVPVIVPAKVCA